MLLTETEKEAFANYETKVFDKSITRRLLEPFWDQIVKVIPEDMSPNMISLAALICLIQAWYLCLTHGDDFPRETTAIAIVLIVAFWTLDAVDSRHAVRIGNDSSLTEFFDHICSSIATIFLVLTLCECYSINNVETIWHYVQIGQLLILNKHLSALKKEYISYRLFGGPGEGVSFFIILLAIRGTLGMAFIDQKTTEVLLYVQQITPPLLLQRKPDLFDAPTVKISRTLFFWMAAWTAFMAARLPYEHRVTRWSLLLCFMYLLIPSGLLFFSFELTVSDAVARGLVTAVLSSDLVVCRMAQRELSPIVVLINMAALVSNFSSFVLVPFYYATILFEVCHYTKLPLLSRYTNVYFDGVFDMPHIGHMNAFKNAAKFGTRLFVGVVNDQDATPYKRRPVMTAKERYEVVGACKHVFKVIQDAPCVKGGLNKEFIKKNNIHVVAHGAEYDNPEDEWYRIPREMGITKILPRHEGMSTSELIKRINQRNQDELDRKTPAL